MSGIYIPGLRVPEENEDELWITVRSDGTVTFNTEWGWTMNKGKAVSVPPHGRLGDLDELPGQMQRKLFEIEDKAEKELGFDETLRRGMQYGHAVCVDAVNEAPTIIPADPVKEETE